MRLSKHVALVYTEEGAVLFDEHRGRYWQLNQNGTFVLRSLLAGATVSAVAATIAHRSPEGGDAVIEDVEHFVGQLQEARVVVS